jgi:chemotaxis receptor (MCP) glutamine deamidase CheD
MNKMSTKKGVIILDEVFFVEEFGDYMRKDVFPGKGYPIKTLVTGDPKDSFYFVDENGRTVLLFKIDEDNRVRSIYSPLRPSEVLSFVRTLGKVDSNLAKYLQSILTPHENEGGELGEIQINNDTHELIFKPYSNRMDIVLQYDLKSIEESYKKLLSYGLNKLPISPKSTYSGNLDDVVTVVQREYAIVSAKKGDKKVANTFALEDCIGLTLYDKDNQIAAVAHIDGGTRVKESISKLMEDLSIAGGQKYEARLFGGYKDSAKILVELIDSLKQFDVDIVEADILEKAQSRNIGISVSGELYNNVFIDNDPSIEDRMMCAGVSMDTPLICHYKP